MGYGSAGVKDTHAEDEPVNRGYFGEPLPALTSVLQREFDEGFQLFIKVWGPQDGLGPRFNARSCAGCHAVPMPGGSGTTPNTFVPQSSEAQNSLGGHAIAQFVIDSRGAIVREGATPPFGMRKPPPLFGVGLLEQVPNETLLELADPGDVDGNGISGRLAIFAGEVGRFGWKAALPTLERFVGLALAAKWV